MSLTFQVSGFKSQEKNRDLATRGLKLFQLVGQADDLFCFWGRITFSEPGPCWFS